MRERKKRSGTTSACSLRKTSRTMRPRSNPTREQCSSRLAIFRDGESTLAGRKSGSKRTMPAGALEVSSATVFLSRIFSASSSIPSAPTKITGLLNGRRKEPVAFLFYYFVALAGALFDAGPIEHSDLTGVIVNQPRVLQDRK